MRRQLQRQRRPPRSGVDARSSSVPNELVVAGQTVQVASPDEVNELDLAANNTQPPAGNGAPADAASSVPAKNEVAETTSKSDS